ncbi:PKD domain-containing protein [Archangium sp.]|uniref:PKD domain-containing protein n=1 Tax=Archangium sp. TaxID=1872627 RepID=UPI002D6472E6|nr:PKD domain-containing protein [Archangium sp.]HYO56262.1 PKD domain-containing protein [Archangium sp.]
MTRMTFTARGLALLALAFLGCNAGGDEAPPQVSTQRKELTGKPLASLGSECVSARQPRLIMAPSKDALELAVRLEGKELNCGETYELVISGPDGTRTSESLIADSQGTVQSSSVIESPPGEHDARLYDSRGEEVAQLLNSNFRYGHLTWRTVGPRTAEFSLVNVFRRVYPGSGPDGLAVTGDTFQETYGGTSLCFGDYSCTDALTYRVTSYDAAQGWIMAQAIPSNQVQVLPGTDVTVVETEPNGTLDTANSMLLGDDYSSTISPTRDSDYVRFTLSQRTRIQVSTVLQTLGDSYLYLYGSNGALLASDDDSGPGLASLIQITLDAGTYFIRAAAYSSYTGQQIVQLRQMGIPPPGPITHTYSSNGPFTAYLSGCCRIDDIGNLYSEYYRLQTRVGFSLANSTPVSSLPPIVEVPTRTPDFSFQIPATDAEGDALTFRLANQYESYYLYLPPDLTVSSTGLVRWNTTRTVSGQLWAVQVIIEERRNGVLIGSSPVDFLLQITGDSGSPPTCVPPTQAAYTVLPGHTLEFTVGTQDPDDWDTVTLSAGGLPWDATMQPSLPLQGPSGTSSTFSYTPSSWEVGYVYSPTFTVTDSQGQTGQCTVNIEVLNPDNWPPVANAGSDQSVGEGSTVTLDGTGSSDRDGEPLTYQWTVVSSTGPEVTLSSDTSATPSFTSSNEGVYTFQLTVTDSEGATDTATVNVYVYNVAPEVSATGGQADEGQEFTSSGSFTDPGADSWTATVDYGDGTGAQPLALNNGTFTLSHRYLDNNYYQNSYWVQITVTDDSGQQGSISVPVEVRNVAPAMTLPPGLTGNEGQPLVLPITFTDPGEDSWWVWVDYGGGYSDFVWLSSREFTLEHTYYTPGTYSLTLTLSDDDGGQQQVTLPVEIHNVAPIVSVQGATLDEGSTFHGSGTFEDPGGQWGPCTATVDYGDGTGAQPANCWSGNFWLWHEYTDSGTYLVTVTVTDSHGGVGTGTATVVVNNVAPWVYLMAPEYYSYEGIETVLNGYIYDPGTQDTWTATVDYGDGTGVQPLEVNSSYPMLRHVYANEGVYTVTFTVTDDDGGVGVATSQVYVYNAPPTVNATGGILDEGSTFTSSGSFTDPGSDMWTARVDYGDGTGWQPLALNGQSFLLEHVYANSGTYEMTIAVLDSDGAEGFAYVYVTVHNVAPVVTVTGGTANEGSAFTSAASITDPGSEGTWTASIDYGDGSYPEQMTLNSRAFTLNHVYAENGTYTVTLRVWDDEGMGTTTTQVVVRNVAPTVTATGSTGNEGSWIYMSGSSTDPGTWDRVEEIRVDYGDGSPVETIIPWYWDRSFTMYHRYADSGTYQVTVSVTDDDGGVGTATATVVVNNVAPWVYLDTFWYGSPEGYPIRLSGSFSDPGTQDTWTATVDYGDGTGVQPLALISRSFTLSHVYADEGTYTVTVTVRDDDGGVGSATERMYVYNITPTVSATGGTENEGSTFTSSGSFTDPGADTWTARVDYGDGTGWQPLALNGKSFLLEHRYANSGRYGVSIIVRDSDGAEGSTIAVVTVRNVAPVVTVTGGTANEGSAFVFSGSITDPGNERTWRVTISDYGDGSPGQSMVVNSRSFTFNHVYAENGTYTATIQVRDDEGTSMTTALVVVHNVAPTVTATGGTGNEGSWIALDASYSDPGSQDTVVARVDYGDGSPVETITPMSWERSFTMSHRYADDGTYLVTISVIDDDGGAGTATVPVEVRNVAPAMTTVVSCDPDEGAPCDTGGQFTDPGTDSWTITVNFGDGSAPQEISLGAGSSRAYDASHVYDDNGLYTVAITLTDDDGGSSTFTHVVQVRNVAPTVTASNDSPRHWGVPVNLVGTATDPSQADTQAGFTALWSLGDGMTASGLTTAHAYAAPGTYPALLSVTDKDGGTHTLPVMTSVTIQKRPGAVTCQDMTALFGFPVDLRAHFVDGLAGGLPGGRSLSFRLGGSTSLGSATTDATGQASVRSPGELMPGSYPITVSFTEDSHYTAAEARCTLTITQSSHGQITGGALRFPNPSHGGFNVMRNEGGPLQGELQFQNSSTSFHAHELTALGISADKRQGWFAGVGRDGRSFTAYVEDNGEPGNADVFKLWIDGVPQTGDGAISGGNIQIHGATELTALSPEAPLAK